MHRTKVVLIVVVAIAASFFVQGCGCSVTGGEGTKAVNVTMGGKVISSDVLKFKPVSYNGAALVIQNMASEQPLEIGYGTPILNGDGTVAATVKNNPTIAPGKTGALVLSAPLTVAGNYYLGKPQDGGKPTIRQLFICPGNDSGGGIGVPDVPDVPEVDITP
jgi:hypothetical protein